MYDCEFEKEERIAELRRRVERKRELEKDDTATDNLTKSGNFSLYYEDSGSYDSGIDVSNLSFDGW